MYSLTGLDMRAAALMRASRNALGEALARCFKSLSTNLSLSVAPIEANRLKSRTRRLKSSSRRLKKKKKRLKSLSSPDLRRLIPNLRLYTKVLSRLT